ncbi:FCD domain-containing protein [Jatrophihabitans cynanchi]|jgi:DNA-binding FadR family transcriptional regulator|uniref:FCD domain-containing protein n=1 Tax=Jatrophihabitans cynanchi TaxID=2944128 RepID=A0ABY7K389_9ACTN|nr:FCD domain-containing protein [Jatrophihabitans sp. SB3-54]WAX58968.1 FCD domain-containing protein [Jatrophihabitans sp. SB3-54]
MRLSDSLPTSEVLDGLAPVTRRTAVDQVADQLRAAVLNMGVGDGLPSEAKLAATFRVSRPVVREALGSLRATGLVASAVGKGWYVASNSIGTSLLLAGSYRSEDLTEVRLHLEVPSAGFAALRHKKSELDFLRRTLQTESSADNPVSAVRQDGRFHIGVARASGNPLLERIVEFIRSGLEEQSRALSTVRGRSERAVAEHWAILEAIGSRDARAAEDAMRAHLRAVSDAVCALAAPLTPQS